MSATIEHTSTARTVDGREVPVAGTYVIDASHSRVGFVARHLVVAKSRGEFSAFRGSVTIGDDPLQSSVDVEIDIASVDTRDAKRDEHLLSDDFFAVEQFPTMHYRSTGVALGKQGSLRGQRRAHRQGRHPPGRPDRRVRRRRSPTRGVGAGRRSAPRPR